MSLANTTGCDCDVERKRRGRRWLSKKIQCQIIKTAYLYDRWPPSGGQPDPTSNGIISSGIVNPFFESASFELITWIDVPVESDWIGKEEKPLVTATSRKLELVSFKLCPYVQRSVIVLKHKKAPFDITYIDLENPPQWFNEISPLGKVPVLKVDDRVTLFESAVINEYIDETVGKPLLSTDPLQRALERAWIAVASELFMSLYHFTYEEDHEKLKSAQLEFFSDLGRFEGILSSEGPYFRGKEFSLMDAAIAPLFVRLYLSDPLRMHAEWKKIPRVRRWAEALVAEPSVKESVVPDFKQLYVESCRTNGSLLY
jgi:glutathione S-transferase